MNRNSKVNQVYAPPTAQPLERVSRTKSTSSNGIQREIYESDEHRGKGRTVESTEEPDECSAEYAITNEDSRKSI